MIKTLFEKVEAVRNEEMEKFMARASDNTGIDTTQLYLGYLVDDKTGENEYKLLTDCSIKTPHNLFYFDIISKLAFGIKDGWTGFAMQPNEGLCVNEIQNLIEIVKTPRMSYEELENFINNINEEKKNKTF